MGKKGEAAAAGQKGGSKRSKKRNRRRKKEEEANEYRSFLRVDKNAFLAPLPIHLKSMVQGRIFTPKDFRLGECIGVGTFGVLRLVTLKHADEEDPPPMVLKTMFKATLAVTKQIDHIKQEKLVHEVCDFPFIVTFLASFQDDRRVFLLLEFVHGGELFGRLQREGRLPMDHVKFYTAELILCLQYLHDMFVAYRDLKPENILLDGNGHVKLCDFGFAKVVKHSQTNTIVGTPEYLAPEIIKGSPHGLPVDFWALGIVVLEMMMGYPPFVGDNPFDTYQKILTGTITYPRYVDVKAANFLQSILLHEPEMRFTVMHCMQHIWFEMVDWKILLEMAIRPPWRPKLSGLHDRRMFEQVPDDKALDAIEYAMPVSKRDARHFADAF